MTTYKCDQNRSSGLSYKSLYKQQVDVIMTPLNLGVIKNVYFQ